MSRDPQALEIPSSSGLNDQRLLPRLSSLLLSYCPSGLSKWRGNLKDHANDEILPVAGEVLHRQRGGSR
jgi:hypothetical protein